MLPIRPAIALALMILFVCAFSVVPAISRDTPIKFQQAGVLKFLGGGYADEYEMRLENHQKFEELKMRSQFAELERQRAEQRAKAQFEMSEKRVDVLFGSNSNQALQKGLEATKSGNYAAAFREWAPVAEQGIPEAQFNLGQLYYRGLGVPKDYTQASNWYGLAGQQGFTSGLNNLGVMFKKGEGFPQNYIQAYILYNVAASLGSTEGAQNRDAIQALMTPNQISEAQSGTREMYNKFFQK